MTMLIPTHGRSYRTQQAAIEDLLAGEQFELPNGKVCTVKSVPFLLTKFPTLTLFYDLIHGHQVEFSDLKELQ